MKLAFLKKDVLRKKKLVPKKYEDYIIDLNNLCTLTNTDIYLERDKEVNRIFNTLLKSENANVFVLGPNGVGKSAVVMATVNHVLKKKCYKDLQSFHFLQWNVNKTLATLLSFNEKEKKKVNNLFEFIINTSKHLENGKIVIVLDQFHLIGSSNMFLYYLNALLEEPNISVIGLTTPGLFIQYFQQEGKIISSADIIRDLEISTSKVYRMTFKYVRMLEKRHGVKVSKEILDYITSISKAFPSGLCDPGLTINILERAMVMAKCNNHKAVIRKDVNYNFNFDYELYNKMSESDKRITAYHESGHYIVSKFSENIKNYTAKAITIVPSNDFIGVTTFEFEPEKQTSMDYDYFVDSIASDLAGRVAEKILDGKGIKAKLTSGASADLKHATQTARAIVMEFGMAENFGQNMSYNCNDDDSDYALLSEDTKKRIDEETQHLIDKAYARAEKILEDRRELLDLIAASLLANEVLDEKDLDRLCAQVTKTT